MEKRFRTTLIAAFGAMLCSATSGTSPATIGITEGKSSRHRLTIVSAYSCGYCRVLDMQAMPEIRSRWLARGLQLESIPISIAPTDAAAAIAATCGDMRRYARRSTILFRSQGIILGNWRGASDADRDQALAMQRRGSALRVGRLSGIVALAPSLDLTEEQLAACLSDPSRLHRQRRRETLTDETWHVVGTPTAFLDGRPIGSTWASIQPELARRVGG